MRRGLITQLALLLVSICCMQIAYTWAQATRSYSRNGFITTTDNVLLHYLDAGKGPAIVFVPGLTMPADIWESQIKYFSKTHRVVAMDPRSQGESSQATEGHYPERRAKDIKEIIDRLNLAPVVLVGWSMGGPEVLSYIDQFGTKTIRAVVLVDSFVGDEPNPERLAGHFRNIRAIQAKRQEWTGNWVRSMFAAPQLEKYFQDLVSASLRTPTNTMVTLITSTYVVGDDRRAVLRKLDRPMLYMARAAQRSQGEMIKTILPGAQIEIFQNAGHALFVDEPDRFNKRLDSFIAGLPGK
jgi:microsomal epoxide hydrolase